MSKLTDKQVIIFSVLLFALIYITVHTDAIGNFFIILRPFINGFLLAYLIGIIVLKIETKIPLKSARGISMLIVYLIFAGILTVLLVYIIPILSQNAQAFARTLPIYLFHNNILDIDHLFEFDVIQRTFNLLGFTEYARAATSGVVNILLSFVVSVYALLTKESIFKFNNRLAEIIIPNYANSLREKINKSHIVFQKFLLAQLFASLILGLLSGLVLSLFRVNYAILIGAIIGILNIIPLFGAVIGVVISAAIIFLTNPPMLAAASFVFLLLLQQIDATIVTPKLMGNALNLNPIIVILALVLGTTYLGFIGMLFAVPVTVMIREIVKEKIREL